MVGGDLAAAGGNSICFEDGSKVGLKDGFEVDSEGGLEGDFEADFEEDSGDDFEGEFECGSNDSNTDSKREGGLVDFEAVDFEPWAKVAVDYKDLVLEY